ncbi:hypothetical protein [Conexibacter sp. CPCC 206217]|uniref:hypothetical protein n=1 Tax=Conexibacter sp. CPCC 206217 TaxID=3064574 RepID=UPI0027187E99|nr:hypothetical protein [Conexibacter sp. CPCC 206217]MDO8213893.1 hypothetical protein [Conexibacter sp. CPCC 206217]
MALTLTYDQRTALCVELERDLQADMPEIEIAFTQRRYTDAEQLRHDYEAVFALMDDLHGWRPGTTNAQFPLNMPAAQIIRVLRRIIRHASRRLLKLARSSTHPRHDPNGEMEHCDEVIALCCNLLAQLAAAPRGA